MYLEISHKQEVAGLEYIFDVFGVEEDPAGVCVVEDELKSGARDVQSRFCRFPSSTLAPVLKLVQCSEESRQWEKVKMAIFSAYLKWMLLVTEQIEALLIPPNCVKK